MSSILIFLPSQNCLYIELVSKKIIYIGNEHLFRMILDENQNNYGVHMNTTLLY